MRFSPLISVIVPVYNVEKYLTRCIESILRQTYTNFELILVDDGTPDKSGVICDRYAEKDSRIKVIHKENGGVSSARNVGMDAANGEWITFVDSDDWVTDNCLSTLIAPITNYDYDLIVTSIEIRGLKVVPSLLENESIIYSEQNVQHVVEIISKPRFYGPSAKLYKTEILRSKKITFPEAIKNGEDKIFVAEYLKYCKSIQTLSDVTYYYNRLNECSVTQKFTNVDELPLWMNQYLQRFADICDAYKVDAETKKCRLSYLAAAHLYPYLRNCARTLKNKDAKKAFTNASKILLVWIENSECTYNDYTKSVINALLDNNIDAAYKMCKKHAMLRNIKQVVRILKIRLRGRTLERKRDGLNT